jgi:succinoglycan biosynthesis protein ExoL
MFIEENYKIKKITFLLPVGTHARYQKRIMALRQLGVMPQVFYFSRDYYKGKVLPYSYCCLGTIKHRHYLRRIWAIPRAAYKVRAEIGDSDVLYAFELDMLLIAWLAAKKKSAHVRFIYEVGDIRSVLVGDTLISYLLRWIERFLLRRINLLVVTSEAYLTEYYYNLQGMRGIRYQIIENKLFSNGLFARKDGRELSASTKENRLRIGYFGLIRCRKSWHVLKEVVKRANGRIRLYVRGYFIEMHDVEEEMRSTGFVEYGGPFISPDELPSIYNKIDLAWIAHYHAESNTKWARGNRFYEACYFRKPMISQAGTQDSVAIARWRLGKNINLLDVERAIDEVLQINRSDFIKWQENLARLPEHVYLYTDEHEKLIRLIRASIEVKEGSQ